MLKNMEVEGFEEIDERVIKQHFQEEREKEKEKKKKKREKKKGSIEKQREGREVLVDRTNEEKLRVFNEISLKVVGMDSKRNINVDMVYSVDSSLLDSLDYHFYSSGRLKRVPTDVWISQKSKRHELGPCNNFLVSDEGSSVSGRSDSVKTTRFHLFGDN